jgi:hypothetical protein
MNAGECLDATDKYMRLALKAQSQCRAALETLARIKNPIPCIKQTNIANGPQQASNGQSAAAGPSQTGVFQTTPNKLLEANHGQRLLALALQGLRSRHAGRLQLQAAWLLPVVQGPAHGAGCGALGGPRYPSCACAPVGAFSTDSRAPFAGRTAQAVHTRAAGGAVQISGRGSDAPAPSQRGRSVNHCALVG